LSPTTAPKSLVDWLRAHVDADELKVQPGVVQWREALSEYLADAVAKAVGKEA
jgi:hypothetical protein